MYGTLPVINNLTITNFHTVFEGFHRDGFAFKGESHDFWELVYVVDGEVGITAGDKTMILKKDEIVFHFPNEFHNVWYCGKDYRVFIASFDMHGELVKEFGEKVYKLDGDTKKQLNAIIEEFRLRNKGKVASGKYLEFWADWDNYKIENNILAMKLSIFFLTLHQKQGQKSTNRFAEAQTIYQATIQFMIANLTKNVTVENIAKHLHISPTSLKNIFKQYTGMGVHKYFLRMKINRATELLNDGYSVSETSNILGFSNVSYFSAAYKRETGILPKNIR